MNPMQLGSPVSSTFSFPWLALLVAGLVAWLGMKILSSPEPAKNAELRRKMEASMKADRESQQSVSKEGSER